MNDRAAVERQIVGALKSTIDAHGPITRENVSSAAKRIVSELKAKERMDANAQAPDRHPRGCRRSH